MEKPRRYDLLFVNPSTDEIEHVLTSERCMTPEQAETWRRGFRHMAHGLGLRLDLLPAPPPIRRPTVNH